jgi:hypothetical protein
MSRLDSLVGSWVIGSYSYTPGNANAFNPTGRVFGFKEDGTWLDKAGPNKTYLGVWILQPDGKTITISEIDDDQTIGLPARIVSLSHRTLKLDFVGPVYTLSINFSRAGG